MRRQSGARSLPEVGGATGPAPGRGVVDQPGADGVEFDVAVTGEHVLLAIDQAGLVAAFPECAAAAMAGVEQADVLTPELLHHPADVARLWRRGQQVDVVVHQYVRMQVHACRQQCFTQERQVAAPVAVIQEAGQPVVPALHDVLRDSGQVDAGKAGHACSMSLGRNGRRRKRVWRGSDSRSSGRRKK